MAQRKYEIYREDGRFFWQFKARNGSVVARGREEGYDKRGCCHEVIEALRDPDALIEEVEDAG